MSNEPTSYDGLGFDGKGPHDPLSEAKPPPREEYWVKRDGTKIAVGNMDVDHLRNTLRMIIRNKRRITRNVARAILDEMLDDNFDWEAESDAQAHRDLANPKVFFPLLDGGVHGSPELQKKYGQ